MNFSFNIRFYKDNNSILKWWKTVILNKIIEDNDLKSNPELVKELIEERSSGFKDPEQYKNWIYGNEEQLKNIESLALEEQVTDLLISQSKSEEENLSFEEVMTMG